MEQIANQSFEYHGTIYVTNHYLADKFFPHLSYRSASRSLPAITQFLNSIELSNFDREAIFQQFNIRRNAYLYSKKAADQLYLYFKHTDLTPTIFADQFRRWQALRDRYPDFIEFDNLRKTHGSRSNKKYYSYQQRQTHYQAKKGLKNA
jgi:hypothetical protein